MQHECAQAETIRKLEVDLAVAKSDIATVKGDITGIRESLKQFNWWFIGILVSIIGGMATILATLIFKG